MGRGLNNSLSLKTGRGDGLLAGGVFFEGRGLITVITRDTESYQQRYNAL